MDTCLEECKGCATFTSEKFCFILSVSLKTFFYLCPCNKCIVKMMCINYHKWACQEFQTFRKTVNNAKY